MTRDNKQNLERKLEHLIDLIQMIIEQYPHITCSERASMLLTIAMAAKQVSKNVGIVRDTLLNHLIDEFKVDYADYVRRFEDCRKRLEECVAGAPMLSAIDTLQPPATQTTEIVNRENRQYEMCCIKGLSRIDYFLYYFIENSYKVYDDILESFTLIIADLKGIDEDYYALIDGRLDLESIYGKLRQQYQEVRGAKNRADLEDQLSIALTIKGCSSQSIAHLMRTKSQEYDYITMSEIDGESAAKVILQNRTQLTFPDLEQHFRNQQEWSFLKEKATGIQKAEEEGSLPQPSNNSVVVIGTNVEQQTNNYYINGREAN